MEHINQRKDIFEKLFLIFLITIIVFIGVFYLNNRTQIINFGKDFTYTIGKCDQSGILPEDLQIETKNHFLEFEHNLNIYCNASEENLRLELHKKGRVLEIREIFTASTVAKCVCPLKIKGQISNLKSGKYTSLFILENRYVDQTEKTIGEKVISIL